jgi:hypothetical protein
LSWKLRKIEFWYLGVHWSIIWTDTRPAHCHPTNHHQLCLCLASRVMDIPSIIVVMKFTFLLIVTFTSWNLQMLSVYIGLFRNTNTFKYPLGSHILVVHGVIWQDRTGAGERSVVYLVFFIAQASAELRSFVVASLNHYRFTGSSCIFVLLAWLKYLYSFSLALFLCCHVDSAVAYCSDNGLYLSAHDFVTGGDSALSLRYLVVGLSCFCFCWALRIDCPQKNKNK